MSIHIHRLELVILDRIHQKFLACKKNGRPRIKLDQTELAALANSNTGVIKNLDRHWISAPRCLSSCAFISLNPTAPFRWASVAVNMA